MTIAQEKKELRKRMLALRDSLSMDQVEAASKACLQKILDLPVFQEEEWIYLYLSFRKEMDTLSMLGAIQAAGKKLAVPRIEGRDMHFYQIKSLEDCQPGTMGILEPQPGPDPEDKRITRPGLMLMPGLAFDRDLHRLGFGGGFYDAYLARHSDLKTAAICYDFQIVDHVPHENHDLCPQMLISDQRLLEP